MGPSMGPSQMSRGVRGPDILCNSDISQILGFGVTCDFRTKYIGNIAKVGCHRKADIRAIFISVLNESKQIPKNPNIFVFIREYIHK